MTYPSFIHQDGKPVEKNGNLLTSFVEEFDISTIRGAEYNPRFLPPEAFEMLKKSIAELGIIKPVIVNAQNGKIVAGHQRTKSCLAIGITKTPVVLLKECSMKDEISFNQFHNSVETEKSKAWVDADVLPLLPFGYSCVDKDMFSFEKNRNPEVIRHMSDMILEHGPWGSVVIDELGDVCLNADYAVACKIMEHPLLVFKMKNEMIGRLHYYLKQQYGEYSYANLGQKPYTQTYCQPNRLAGKSQIHSLLWESMVLKAIKPTHRVCDFGAGKMAYVKNLYKAGYNVHAYEPFPRNEGKTILNMELVYRLLDDIEKDVNANGLYEFMVCDSVLNAISNNHFEDTVLTSINAMMKQDGILYLGTRSKEAEDKKSRTKTTENWNRVTLRFYDKENYSAYFYDDSWIMMKFHTVKTLDTLLRKYFGKVKVVDMKQGNHLAVCGDPLWLGEEHYRMALNEEFNIEYPDNFRHNRQEGAVNAVMNALLAARGPK
jgi:hypothetical protein